MDEFLNLKSAMEAMWRRQEVLFKQLDESNRNIIAVITDYLDGTSINREETSSANLISGADPDLKKTQDDASVEQSMLQCEISVAGISMAEQPSSFKLASRTHVLGEHRQSVKKLPKRRLKRPVPQKRLRHVKPCVLRSRRRKMKVTRAAARDLTNEKKRRNSRDGFGLEFNTRPAQKYSNRNSFRCDGRSKNGSNLGLRPIPNGAGGETNGPGSKLKSDPLDNFLFHQIASEPSMGKPFQKPTHTRSQPSQMVDFKTFHVHSLIKLSHDLLISTIEKKHNLSASNPMVSTFPFHHRALFSHPLPTRFLSVNVETTPKPNIALYILGHLPFTSFNHGFSLLSDYHGYYSPEQHSLFISIEALFPASDGNCTYMRFSNPLQSNCVLFSLQMVSHEPPKTLRTRSLLIGPAVIGKSWVQTGWCYRKGEAGEVNKCSFKYAWVLDKSEAKRERGIFIDIALWKCKTSKYYCIVIEVPCQLDSIKKIISGINHGDCTVLIIHSTHGSSETGVAKDSQAHEHGLFGFTVGVQEVICCCNSMCARTPKYSKFSYEAIEYLRKDVYRIDGSRTVLVGRVETGTIKTSIVVFFYHTGQTTEVKSVKMHHEVLSGDSVGLNLKNAANKDLKQGLVASNSKDDPAKVVANFMLQVIIMNYPVKNFQTQEELPNSLTSNESKVIDLITALTVRLQSRLQQGKSTNLLLIHFSGKFQATLQFMRKWRVAWADENNQTLEFRIAGCQVIGVPNGVVENMKEGKKALVIIQPAYAVGVVGSSPRSTIDYCYSQFLCELCIELILNIKGRIGVAEKKNEGCVVFQACKYARATNRFEKGTFSVKNDSPYSVRGQQQDKALKTTNKASCNLKFKYYKKVEKKCTKLLENACGLMKAKY